MRISLIALLLVGQAFAADIYIDTSAAVDGTGSKGDPRNVVITTLTDNNNYWYRYGTTPPITDGGSGFAISGGGLDNVTVGAYCIKDRLTVATLTHTTTTAHVLRVGHGLVNGDSVTIVGASPGPYNGDFVVAVTDSSHYNYTMGSDPGVDASGTIYMWPHCKEPATTWPAKPIFDANSAVRLPFYIFGTTTNVVIQDIEIREPGTAAPSACMLLGTNFGWIVRRVYCHDSAYYGILVNEGFSGVPGQLLNNRIENTGDDGIGAHTFGTRAADGGIVIRGNIVKNAADDGIDILGTWGAVVEYNLVTDGQSPGGVGLKMGGNSPTAANPDQGGGRNIVRFNRVYRARNFGIWNRGAEGNTYEGNIVCNSWVNYNLAAPHPSYATVINNTSVGATFAGGLSYAVFIPGPTQIAHASGNKWVQQAVNIHGIGIVTSRDAYRAAMAPFDSDASFASSWGQNVCG